MNYSKKHAIRDLKAPQTAQDIDDNFDTIFKALRILEGQIGSTSSPGIIGADGISIVGPPGEDGEDGPMGPPGLRGADGAAGAAGPITLGPMGLNGEDGEDGYPIPGPQGPTGATGDAGPAGPAGGPMGPPGLDGEDGGDHYYMLSTGSSGAASEWDVNIVLSADFDVVNSAVLTSITELTFPVVAGEVWYIEGLIVYAGNGTAVDMRTNATFPTATGVHEVLYTGTTDAIATSTQRVNAAANYSTLSVGTRSVLTAYECFNFRSHLWFNASGDYNLTQANQNAGAGNTTRILAGSVLRAKKLI